MYVRVRFIYPEVQYSTYVVHMELCEIAIISLEVSKKITEKAHAN